MTEEKGKSNGNGKSGVKRGRPLGSGLKPVDLDLLASLCKILCSDEEIGAIMGISPDTLTSRKRTDPDFLRVYEENRAAGRRSIRRRQFELAQDGNPALLIWLGKQLLGQSDSQKVAISGDGKPIRIEHIIIHGGKHDAAEATTIAETSGKEEGDAL